MAADRVYLVLRTHFWSSHVADAGERWRELFGNDNVFVLADETNAPLDCGSFPKIQYSNQRLAEFGLGTFPDAAQCAWYNGDYGLYFADAFLGDYANVFVAEYDVVPQIADPVAWRAAIDRLATNDFCAARFRRTTESWRWDRTVRQLYDQPGGALLCFCGGKPTVIRALLDRRRRLTQMMEAGKIAVWPFAEAFVASELIAHPEWRFADIDVLLFAGKSWFTHNIPIYADRVLAVPGADNRLMHPVLAKDRFLLKLEGLISYWHRRGRGLPVIGRKLREIAPTLERPEIERLAERLGPGLMSREPFASILASAGGGELVAGHGHLTTGGSEERIEATLPPVFRPKTVPRS
jgi:hypothetical protein